MSTTSSGSASRRLSRGSRLWPPASTVLSRPSRLSVSSTEAGALYSNGAGFTSRPLEHAPELLLGEGRVGPDPVESVRDRVRHGGGRTEGAALADPLRAERV